MKSSLLFLSFLFFFLFGFSLAAPVYSWRGYHNHSLPAGWTVSLDGRALTRTGDGDDIMTDTSYDDFEISCEWKIATGGDSGILYRVATGFQESYYSGPEVQILDDKNHPDGKYPNRSSDSLYDLYPPGPNKMLNPVGQWNQFRLLVLGNRVEHWLNDKRVLYFEMYNDDWKQRVARSKFATWKGFAQAKAGHIVFQNEVGNVWFQNIDIRRL